MTASAPAAASEPPRTTPAASSAADAGGGTARGAHLRRLLLLFVVAVAVLLPGIDRLPLTDRDEALYVQATRQMLETGNWVDIRFQDEPRYKKPIGIYWLQGATALATGEGAEAPLWAYRLPSFVAAVLTVLFTYGIGALFGGPATGLIAGLLAVSTFSLGFEARLAKTDSVLAATVLAAEFALARAWLDRERRRSFGRNALFWTAIGVGVLIKGPITPLVAGATLAVLSIRDRSTALWRSLSPLKGLAWVALLDLPWLVAIGVISHGAFFAQSVGHDMLGKIANAQEAHGAPPGTYLVASLGIFWPMVVFAPAGLLWGWRHRREPIAAFLLAWIVPCWIVFELVATKLPNYVLPFMPAIAILAALALRDGFLETAGRWWRLLFAYVAVGAVLLGGGFEIAHVWLQGRVHWLGLVPALIGIGLGVWAWRLLLARRLLPGVAATVAASGWLFALGYAGFVPATKEIWLSDTIAGAVLQVRPCLTPRPIVVGYAEPSIVFRLGTDTLRTDAAAAATAMHEATCAVAAVDTRKSSAFVAAARALGDEPVPIRSVSGRNLNGMRPQVIDLYVKGGPFGATPQP